MRPGGPARIRLPACAAAAFLLLAGCGSTTVDNAALTTAAHDGQRAEVTVQGPVRTLLGDITGPHGTHQRFDIDVEGLIVEVDHNLGLAPRVPVMPAAVVTVHGQFEPDPGHPVIHDTHHATGRHEGGWIDLDGHRYE